MIYLWYANVPMCPNELKINSEYQKYIKVYQTTLKSVWNPFFFYISLHWIFTTLPWKPIGSLVLWPNHSTTKKIGVQFWTFAGFLDFFIIKDLFFWIWVSGIEWQDFWTLILKWFTFKKKLHFLTISTNLVVKKRRSFKWQ